MNEILDAEIVEEAGGPIDHMAPVVAEARQRIIDTESMKKINLGGNRKQRRSMAKQFKIPKFALQVRTKKEADEHTKFTQNAIDMKDLIIAKNNAKEEKKEKKVEEAVI